MALNDALNPGCYSKTVRPRGCKIDPIDRSDVFYEWSVLCKVHLYPVLEGNCNKEALPYSSSYSCWMKVGRGSSCFIE